MLSIQSFVQRTFGRMNPLMVLLLVSIISSCGQSVDFASFDYNNGTATTKEVIIKENNKTLIVEEILNQYEDSLAVYVEKILKLLLPYALKENGNHTISSTCERSLLRWINGLRNIKEWAIEMIDASGKLPPGILKRNSWVGGDYDQCLNVVEPKYDNLSEEENESIRGQYCVLKVDLISSLRQSIINAKAENEFFEVLSRRKTILRNLDDFAYKDISLLPFQLRVDICVPDRCTKNDLEEITKAVLGETIYVDRCEKKESVRLSALQITCCSIFSAIFGWVVIGTILDLKFRFMCWRKSSTNREDKSMLLRILTSASVYRNTVKLLAPDSDRSLDFTYSLRFISILWIILSHAYIILYLAAPEILGNLTIVNQFKNQFVFSLIPNGFLAVDTFLFLSAYFQVVGKLKDPTANFNYFTYIAIKFIRLTIAQLATLGTVFLLPLLGTGPFWKEEVLAQADTCKTDWWKSLTYTKNFSVDFITCQGQLWYLSLLMQYYLFTMIMIFIFKRWPRIAVGICALAICGGVISSAVYFCGIDIYDPSDPLSTLPNVMKFDTSLYLLPNGHMAQYSIGLLVGYFMARHPKYRYTKMQKVLLILSILCTFVSTFGGFLPADLKVLKIMYDSTYTVIWTVGIAGLTIVCSSGRGGVLNRLLSLGLFVPLGRLSLFAYLLHMNVIYYYGGIQRQFIYLTHFNMFQIFLFVSVIAFVLSYVFYVCIQMPFDFLISLIFARKQKSCHRRRKDNRRREGK